MDYKSAVKSYRAEAGKHYTRPDKAKCHYSRGGWYLIDKAGNVVCIVGDGCLWGNRLAVYFAELTRGHPVPPLQAAGIGSRSRG